MIWVGYRMLHHMVHTLLAILNGPTNMDDMIWAKSFDRISFSEMNDTLEILKLVILVSSVVLII